MSMDSDAASSSSVMAESESSRRFDSSDNFDRVSNRSSTSRSSTPRFLNAMLFNEQGEGRESPSRLLPSISAEEGHLPVSSSLPTVLYYGDGDGNEAPGHVHDDDDRHHHRIDPDLERHRRSTTDAGDGMGMMPQRGPRRNRRRSRRRRRINSENSLRRIRPFMAPHFLMAATQTWVEVDRRQTQSLVASTSQQPRTSYGTMAKKRGVSSESSSSEEADGSEENGNESIEEKVTGRQWATVSMLVLNNFCSTAAFSCIAPFYPAEAQEKGLDSLQTGIVFGIFELTKFIFAPILGKYMYVIGSRLMCCAGLAVTGVTAILFGLLNGLPSGSAFFWASLVIRCAGAAGDAAFSTSSFAIGAKCFPPRYVGRVVGVMETFAGLGCAAGPLIGGFLYDYGGFQLPFFVLGTLLLLAACLSCFVVEQFEDEPQTSSKGMMGILRIGIIWIMLCALVSCALSLSFLDPTLVEHLDSFGLSITLDGMMFLLCGGIYTITALFLGLFVGRVNRPDRRSTNRLVQLTNRINWKRVLMVFGTMATAFAMLIIGPTPLLHIEKSLWLIAIALAVLGAAEGTLNTLIFQNILDVVREVGYDDSFQTYGLVSGVFQSALAFGAFIGPTVGAVSASWIGFPWTTTIIAGVNTVILLLLMIYSTWNSTCCSRNTREYQALLVD